MVVYNKPFPDVPGVDIGTLALGTFDGVHIGHSAVISEAVRIASDAGMMSGVWCFSKPPKAVFNSSVKPLTPPDEKARLIESLGVDLLIMPEPTREILAMSPLEFLDAVTKALRPRHVVVGFNYTYGKNAVGNVDTLREYLDKKEIPLTVIQPVEYGGIPVSSTLIRRLTEEGDEKSASKLLGKVPKP